MAKLKATPKNFTEALAVLNGRVSMRLGNNTYLESFTDGTQTDLIAVRLHATQIVKFYPDGRVTLHTGGYHTTTTKDRLNQFVYGRVYQKNWDWFYAFPVRCGASVEAGKTEGTVAFEDGLAVA